MVDISAETAVINNSKIGKDITDGWYAIATV